MKFPLYPLALALLFLSISPFFYGRTLVDYQEIPIFISVGDHLGFNVNNSALYFGTLQKGAYGFRSFVITNEKCIECTVEIKINPALARWIFFSESSFRLHKGESREIIAYAFVPDDALPGNYQGTVFVYFRKPI